MKIRSRFLTKVVAWFAVLALRTLYGSCRLNVALEVPGTSPYENTGDQRYLYCIWHDHLLMAIFGGKCQKMAGLVSTHQDGSYLADAMKMVGITPVRGSSKKGGTRALRELLDRIAAYHVAITPDGPRGPRRTMKDGILYLASRTGRPIIPSTYTCRRGWRIRGNWTDMLLPRPFTEVQMRGGKPFFVPPNAGREELERYGELLDAEMQRIEAAVETQFSVPAATELRRAA